MLVELVGSDVKNSILFYFFKSSLDLNTAFKKTIIRYLKDSKMILEKKNKYNYDQEENVTKKKKKNLTVDTIKFEIKSVSNSDLDIRFPVKSNSLENINVDFDKQNFELKEIYKEFKLKFYAANQIKNVEKDDYLLIIDGNAITKEKSINFKKRDFVYSLIFINNNFNSSNHEIQFVDLTLILECKIKDLVIDVVNYNNSKISHSKIVELLPWIQNLSKESKMNLISNFERVECLKGYILKKINEKTKYIIYILSGKLFKVREKKNMSSYISNNSNSSEFENVAIYVEGEIIGVNDYFLNLNSNDPYMMIAKPIYPTILYILNYDVLNTIISKPMKMFIRDNFFKIDSNLMSNSNSFQPQSIKLISYIDQGSYGLVNLVKFENSIYALKSVNKKMVNGRSFMLEYIKNERNNLKLFNNPFILKLNTTFKTKHYCHYLFEYIDGYTINKLAKKNLFLHNHELCEFYYTNLIIILDHIHKKNIIHRDIKPANLIIQRNGFLKLIDFGLSKEVKNFAYTVIGSPYFIAPEVLLGNGYTMSCDYWSAAVCLYKLFYGKYPYGEDSINALDVYKCILSDGINIDFPENITNESKFFVKNMIHLFTKNVNNRRKSLKEITELFRIIYWKNIIDLKITPPFIPKEISFSNDYYNANDNNSQNNEIINFTGVPLNDEVILRKQNKPDDLYESDEINTETDKILFDFF